MKTHSRRWRFADSMLVPLAWYVGVSLLLPLLNGTPFDARFRRHAVTVMIVAAAIAGGWSALRRFRGEPSRR